MKNKKKLEDLVKGKQKVLFKAKSVFPFELFPDEILIDLNKVTLVNRKFLMGRATKNIVVADIHDVSLTIIFFFASIQIRDKNDLEAINKVNFLNVTDASRAKKNY